LSDKWKTLKNIIPVKMTKKIEISSCNINMRIMLLKMSKPIKKLALLSSKERTLKLKKSAIK